jgi:hypothetical protein
MPDWFRDPDTGELKFRNPYGEAIPAHGFSAPQLEPQPEPWAITEGETPSVTVPQPPLPEAGVDPEPYGVAPEVPVFEPEEVERDRMFWGMVPDELPEPPPQPLTRPQQLASDREDIQRREDDLLAREGEEYLEDQKKRRAIAQQQDAEMENRRLGLEKMQEQGRQEAAARQHNWEVGKRELANMKVDPSKFFRDRGTLGTLMMAVSAALGGFDAPFHGGKNRALELIERGIEREMKAQQANIAKKGRMLGMELSYMQFAARSSRDDEERYNKTTMLIRDDFIRRLEAIKLGTPERDRLKIERMQLGLQEKNQRLAERQMEKDFNRSLTLQKNRRANLSLAEQMRANRANEALRRGQLGLGYARLAMQRKLTAAKAGATDAQRKYGVWDPRTGKLLGMVKTTGAEATKFREQMVNRYGVASQMKDIIRFARSHGRLYSGPWGNKFQTADGRKLQSMYNDMITSIILAKSGKQATDKEREYIMRIFPPPQSFTDRSSAEKAWLYQLSRMGKLQNLSNNAHLTSPVDSQKHFMSGIGKESGIPKEEADDLAIAVSTGTDLSMVTAKAIELGNKAGSMTNADRSSYLKMLAEKEKELAAAGHPTRGGGFVTGRGEGIKSPAEAIRWARHKINEAMTDPIKTGKGVEGKKFKGSDRARRAWQKKQQRLREKKASQKYWKRSIDPSAIRGEGKTQPN